MVTIIIDMQPHAPIQSRIQNTPIKSLRIYEVLAENFKEQKKLLQDALNSQEIKRLVLFPSSFDKGFKAAF